jgi:hypothetical protein
MTRRLPSILLFPAVTLAVVCAAYAVPAPQPAAPTPSWQDQALAGIAGAEYRFSWHDGVLAAPNRAHDLRTRLGSEGFSVVSRTRGEAAFHVELDLIGFGRPGSVADVAPGVVVAGEGLAEIRREAITEWFINGTDGLEHGLTLTRPPGAGGGTDRGAPLVLVFRLGGDAIAFPEGADGKSILFKDGRGAPVVRYGALAATDALGRNLSAWMAIEPGRLTITIDDGQAVWPITVDPLASSPNWVVTGRQLGAGLGNAVSTAGDIDGDGYSDVIVGAYAYDDGQVDEGKVFVYRGGPSGLSTTPAWTAQVDQASASFGSSVGAAGDVNGDGYGDVIVGAYTYDKSFVDEGAAFLWFGGPGGLGPDGTASNAAWRGFGGQAGADYGVRVARAGDVNGDGYDDIVVGAFGYDYLQVDGGAAYVYHGSPSGPSSTYDWFSTSGEAANAYFGGAVATAGDVNGDGYDDVVIGEYGLTNTQPAEGGVYLFFGSASGLSSFWFKAGGQAGAQFGYSVAGVGDVNGDGFADFVVGSPQSDDGGHVNNGRIDLWLGGAGGPAAAPSWTFASGQDFAQLGFAVAAAGDVNGDGYADILAGSDVWDGSFADEGRAWLFSGKSGVPASTPSWTASGGQAGAYMGDAVSSAGDVNGDGYADIIVGVYGWDDTRLDSGAARVFQGSADGLKATADWAVSPGQAFAQFGYSVSSAGDVNADGFSDVIVGAYLFDNGQNDEGAAFVYHGGPAGLSTSPSFTIEGNQPGAWLGYSVSSAGDVNGDGYGDVVAGAPAFSHPEGSEGAAMVYLGGFSGLTGVNFTLEMNQAGANLGWSVATAGDVNGDGYGDVVVSAPFWDDTVTDRGGVFVSYGSAPGPGPLTQIGAGVGQGSGRFGNAVASAGDVNRDGYSDVVVGCEYWSNFSGSRAGKIFLFYGSSGGLSTTPSAWAPEGSALWQLGHAVASAGDVNGDGYADILVGAPYYFGGQTDEGAAFLYFGRPTGPGATADWSFEGDQASASVSNENGVASAGDVNNDGYSDVIIGASRWDEPGHIDAGKAWLFLGSPSGLSTTPAWSQVGAAGTNQFGRSVASAGDVDGDGYADILVGEALNSEGGNQFQGKAWVFFGNGGHGRRHDGHQLTYSNTRAIAPLGIVDSDQAIRIELSAAIPAGRDRTAIQVEIKPLGTPFDGSGTNSSLTWLTGMGTLLREHVDIIGLSALTPYHWRARTSGSRSPFYPRSPWFGVADNARTLTDFRTPCLSQYWYRDADGDGHGNPSVYQFACSLPAGYVLSFDDCDDANAMRFPGNPEVCDGLDNNCDGLVDNTALPSGSSALTVAKAGATANLSWSGVAGASSYDATRGVLSRLRTTGGNWASSVDACLANNTLETSVSDPAVPSIGDAWWYLVRGCNCGGGGTYDDGSASQSGPRDGGIAGSGLACP